MFSAALFSLTPGVFYSVIFPYTRCFLQCYFPFTKYFLQRYYTLHQVFLQRYYTYTPSNFYSVFMPYTKYFYQVNVQVCGNGRSLHQLLQNTQSARVRGMSSFLAFQLFLSVFCRGLSFTPWALLISPTLPHEGYEPSTSPCKLQELN